jgi:hypothetical protein
MSARTAFLSKFIGLYLIVIGLVMLVHKQSTVDTLTAMVHNPQLMFLSGVLAVVAGLALILGHNVWSGGTLPIVVTLVGWAALTKGLLLLFLSPDAAPQVFLGGLQYDQLFYLYTGIIVILGIYLTYGGFAKKDAP